MAGRAGPGAFGKLPAHGDFLAFQLADDLRLAWDGLVSAGLDAFRRRAGDAWLDIYLTSPLWRFAASPGIVGARPLAGVMIPSVDRVGRYFPFAILADLPETVPPARLREEAASWFEAAGRLALRLLDEEVTLARLAPELSALGLPALAKAPAPPLGLFWSEGSPHVPAGLARTVEPPSAAFMASLFDGGWTADGIGVAS